mmetsp:Transcript_24242/g.57384  ORF Transcript_24242/g.57384 Transcript_24242/m.57384 type:complete len:557 (-) Transcript_24242:2513-4183(-)
MESLPPSLRPSSPRTSRSAAAAAATATSVEQNDDNDNGGEGTCAFQWKQQRTPINQQRLESGRRRTKSRRSCGLLIVTLCVALFTTTPTTCTVLSLEVSPPNHQHRRPSSTTTTTPKMSRRFDKLDQIRRAALSPPSSSSTPLSSSSSSNDESSHNNSNTNDDEPSLPSQAGRLEELKQREAELAEQLAAIRMEKLSALRSKPLTIGIVGYGRFGQFIAKTFARHGKVVVTSRSDYTDVADAMGAKYIPLSDPDEFLAQDLDVIILATSILSFESTIQQMVPSLRKHITAGNTGPLIVDVLSVKEHPRDVMIETLPVECDILCTHPMFGPDSGKNGWHNLNFVYEKTRIDQVVFDPDGEMNGEDSFFDSSGRLRSIHEDSEAHVEAMDRIERFLSIWEEEGCRMVPMSCKSHDKDAANSQFITHLMGRILGAQGLQETPIDTKGFESVLKLIDSTTADSFDLFYGLYKYNQNSVATIQQLKAAMDDVVDNLKVLEKEDMERQLKQLKRQQREQEEMQLQQRQQQQQQQMFSTEVPSGAASSSSTSSSSGATGGQHP